MNSQPKFKQNPLAGLMRQPKIYIRLPSKGEFWAPESLLLSETGEYPVYSMTAKDELMLKIPDALINGQAIVDVIEHCMPNVKNAWAIPNIDLDVILIAIRIATYGEKMKLPISAFGVDTEYELDLRYLMSHLQDQIKWESRIDVNSELVVFVKPVTYKQISESSVQSFETQRILEIAGDNTISDDVKTQTFKETFERLNNLTVGLINNAVYKIESAVGTTDDRLHIKEFMENSDKDVFDAVKKHIETLREHNSIKPLKINPTQEMIDAGSDGEQLEIPLVFDPSTFFA